MVGSPPFHSTEYLIQTVSPGCNGGRSLALCSSSKFFVSSLMHFPFLSLSHYCFQLTWFGLFSTFYSSLIPLGSIHSPGECLFRQVTPNGSLFSFSTCFKHAYYIDFRVHYKDQWNTLHSHLSKIRIQIRHPNTQLFKLSKICIHNHLNDIHDYFLHFTYYNCSLSQIKKIVCLKGSDR